MSELKARCPFCGNRLKIVESRVSDYGYDLVCDYSFRAKNGMTYDCPLGAYGFLDDELLRELANTRPLEDALQAQIDELKDTEKWLRGLLDKSQNAGKSARDKFIDLHRSLEEAVDELSASEKLAICADILRDHGLVEVRDDC